MSNLILELFSEEIPANKQEAAINSAEILLEKKLKSANIKDIKIKGFITPRRIAITIENLPKEIVLPKDSIKGPKISASSQAIDGFLKKNKLKNKSDLDIKEIKKEKYYFYNIAETKILIQTKLVSILEDLIHDISKLWPKTMRSGTYDILWIRPLRNILCLLDNKILQIKYGHLHANNVTYGHRFLSNNKAIKISDYDHYFKVVKDNYVVLDHRVRKEQILSGFEKNIKDRNLKLILDEELLSEVTGLVEYPVILLGEIDKKFMFLPDEILITTLKNHQKYFCLRAKDNKLKPYFYFKLDINY